MIDATIETRALDINTVRGSNVMALTESLRLPQIVLVLCMVMMATRSAQGDDRFRKVIDIDSWGAPRGIGSSERPQYFVWQDEQGWHVRTDTAGRQHEFDIEIQTVGGRILKLENFSGLEGRRRRGQRGRTDRGRISSDKRGIKARFVTSVKTDGIDFTVDANTTTVCFRLLIHGEERPNCIAVGANKVEPPSAVFALARQKK